MFLLQGAFEHMSTPIGCKPAGCPAASTSVVILHLLSGRPSAWGSVTAVYAIVPHCPLWCDWIRLAIQKNVISWDIIAGSYCRDAEGPWCGCGDSLVLSPSGSHCDSITPVFLSFSADLLHHTPPSASPNWKQYLNMQGQVLGTVRKVKEMG